MLPSLKGPDTYAAPMSFWFESGRADFEAGWQYCRLHARLRSRLAHWCGFQYGRALMVNGATIASIGPARDIEAERGISVNYGWTCIAQDGDEELFGVVAVEPEKVIEFLHKSAKWGLEPGTRYEIRRAIPHNYGRSHRMAWYHAPTFADAPTWGDKPAGHDPAGGYFLVGEYVTPKAETA